MRAKEPAAGAVAVLRQIGEGHSVVGQHRVNLVREGRRDVPQESCVLHLAGAIMELDTGELGDAIDGEEHDQLAVRMAQFAAVDVDIANRGLRELAALRHRLACRQPGDAVAFETAMQA